MQIISFEVFIEFVAILLLFYVFVFFGGCEACEIWIPWREIKAATPALKGEVLITELPGKTP